jgi:hypothetical protein
MLKSSQAISCVNVELKTNISEISSASIMMIDYISEMLVSTTVELLGTGDVCMSPVLKQFSTSPRYHNTAAELHSHQHQ